MNLPVQRTRDDGVGHRDFIAMAVLGIYVGLLFGPPALSGRTFFWGDLIYIHHPWRALACEMMQRGELPLWNPFAYLGMPLAAQMQSAVWYPGTLPFYLFPFSWGLVFYHATHFWLAGLFTFLWLRRMRLPRVACMGGAAVFMLNGGLVSRIPFLNHVSTIAYFPALLLVAQAPTLLALSVALAFFSGYPPMLAGELPAAWMITQLLESRRIVSARSFMRTLRPWTVAGGLSLGLTACLLYPAMQLALDSRRSGGIQEEESLLWSYSPQDLIQFTAPPLIRLVGKTPGPGEPSVYSPTILWWKTSYLGLGGCAAVLIGLMGLPSLAWVGGIWAYLGAVLLLILGATNPLSRWIWTHAGPLHYLRYPGNMVYLAAPLFAWLAAIGLGRFGLMSRRLSSATVLAALGLAGELMVYAYNSEPKVGRGYFTDAGPLVRFLQNETPTHRYLASPRALQWHRGVGPDDESAALDLKHRLYGLTNMPYHLYGVGNFGEPLIPGLAYAFMDFLYMRSSLSELEPWLGWADAKIVFTRDIKPSQQLRYLGHTLWHIYGTQGPVARAFWFNEGEGARIPAGLSGTLPDLGLAVPLEIARMREDRYRVFGSFDRPGWVFVSEPRAPGWVAHDGAGPVIAEPALMVFQKLRVPAGHWQLSFRYNPVPWRVGRIVTALILCAMAAYWYNRLRRHFLH